MFRSKYTPSATVWLTSKQLFVQLLPSTIPASIKQLQTSQDQLSIHWCISRNCFINAHASVRSIGSVESIHNSSLAATYCWSLATVWTKKYIVGNSGQLRALLSRSTALISAGGSKAAIWTAMFLCDHKSLLLSHMRNFVAHFFAACCVTVYCAVLAVEIVCTYYSLVCQQVFGLEATGWREVTTTYLVAEFSNPCR